MSNDETEELIARALRITRICMAITFVLSWAAGFVTGILA